MSERVVSFACGADTLVGILHLPADPARTRRGVVLVVGGPQFRVGSHRQFVLLARELAAAGVACLRFDYRGMGDSGGEFTGFERIDEDIRSAVDTLLRELPTIDRLYLWGLCDAASAICIYAPGDARVSGVALFNPWVRSAQSHAQTLVRHYYARQILSGAFWRRLASGGVRVGASVRGFLGSLRAARGSRSARRGAGDSRPFQHRMIDGIESFAGPLLLVTSGQDLTAAEFLEHVASEPRWQRRLAAPGVTRHHLQDSNHTFGRAAWRRQVEQWTRQWLA